MAKDTNNISYRVRYGLGGKAQSMRNLPCMQLFATLTQASDFESSILLRLIKIDHNEVWYNKTVVDLAYTWVT